MKDRKRGDEEMGKEGGKGKETEAEVVVVRFIDRSLERERERWRSGMKGKVWEGWNRYSRV